jgi:acyl carrier protein
MKSRENIAEQLRVWICTESLADRPEVELAADTELLRSGYIDSLDTMRLVVFMERSFGVDIPDEAVIPGSFRSINAMVDLVTLEQGRRESIGVTAIGQPLGRMNGGVD